MSNDPTPWDLAMEAIEDRGCDCDGDPEDIADHTCIAGRCEHALLTERAARDEARKERDQALAARRVVTVCAEHGDVLSSAWEDDDGDLLVTVEPCPLCARDRFDAGRRAAGRNP